MTKKLGVLLVDVPEPKYFKTSKTDKSKRYVCGRGEVK